MAKIDRTKIVAEVQDFVSLQRVLHSDCFGTILISGRIVCLETLVVPYGMILLGKDEKSALTFDLRQKISPVGIVMNEWTTLENLKISITVNAGNVTNKPSCGILIDGISCVLKDVCLKVKTEGSFTTEEVPLFPALYLRHFVEAFGKCLILAQGFAASGIAGRGCCMDQLCFKGSELSLEIDNSLCPAFSQCLVRVHDGLMAYKNMSSNPPQCEVFGSYIFLYGDAVFENFSSNELCIINMENNVREVFLRHQTDTEQIVKKESTVFSIFRFLANLWK